jgi:CheY-like chemotaxis protein
MVVREYPSVPPGLRRVTVVNDSPEFLEMVGQWLQSERYHASLVDSDDISSIEPIRATRPHLLIIDLRLRGAELSGWDVLVAIREDAELGRLPVIICTADTAEVRQRAEQVAQTPGVEILLKPFAIDELEEKVRRLIG